MPPQTMFAILEGSANALALNKDRTQVVIAGRNVFKVFSIEEEDFVESCNLRVGKNLNLNFSCNDVAWNQLEDHLLATAATNGAVVVWNLHRPGRLKQEIVFLDHKRTVNKVSFHPIEPTLLISGSQDGTMKCFDIRTKEATKTFYSNTESVRDVQFSPHAHHQFAAVSDNGNVQLWDMRRPERYFSQFTAHSGPVFACDWHPESNWLATASRDKTIKVWDLSVKAALEYTIHTIASVGHIKWRPQRKYHIASCALVVDCSINVWDVRRPFIPFAAFTEHKDVPSGIIWRGDPHCFLSASRDCTLYQHAFQDACRPATSANPQGMSVNSTGDVAYACRQQLSSSRAVKPNGILKKHPQHSEFLQASSKMHWFMCKSVRETKWFHDSAKRYILTGRSLSDMCDHNAAVARDLGRTHVSLVWSIVKTLHNTRIGDYGQHTPSASGNTTRDDTMSTLHGSVSTSVTAETVIGIGSFQGDGDQRSLLGGETPGDKMSYVGEDEGDNEDNPDHHYNSRFGLGLNPVQQGDFFFGEGEVDPLSLDFDQLNNGGLNNGGLNSQMNVKATPQQEWVLETEAFQLRHELQDRSPPPEKFASRSPDLSEELQSLAMEDQPSSLLCVTSYPQLGTWDPSSIIVEMLRHHGDTLGDVQTAASILVALGDRRRNLGTLDEATQEHWLLGYLDTLARHQLWEVATQVIQLAWLPSVCQLNQQSTIIHTSCGKCGKTLLRSGWLCDRCHNSESSACSVCHQIVRGLYAWCQGCSHGGHLVHMEEWWRAGNKQCPTGCGHICEYS